jgi:hypothetical protein
MKKERKKQCGGVLRVLSVRVVLLFFAGHARALAWLLGCSSFGCLV